MVIMVIISLMKLEDTCANYTPGPSCTKNSLRGQLIQCFMIFIVENMREAFAM